MTRAAREQQSAPGCATSVQSWAITHAGPIRNANQDRFVARDDLGLWLVADGAGGHLGGAAAAQALADEFARLPTGLSDQAIVRASAEALQKVHLAFRRQAREQNHGAAGMTTAVVLILRGDTLTCQWAGDSRAYRFRSSELTLLTRDHSLVQELLDAGQILPAEAECHPQRNIITRAVGADSAILEVASLTRRVAPGDYYLLCSDGLSGTLTDAEIAAAFDLPASTIASALVDTALARIAADNVTAIVISVPGGRQT